MTAIPLLVKSRVDNERKKKVVGCHLFGNSNAHNLDICSIYFRCAYTSEAADIYSLGIPTWIMPSTTLTGYAGTSTTAGICIT